MKKTLLISVTIALLVIPFTRTLMAEDSAADRLYSEEIPVFNAEGSIDDYVIFALKNNPGVRASYYAWKAELERSGGASYLPDPVLSFGYFIESVETRVGPQRYRLGIRQSIPWIGKLSAKKEMALQSAAALFETFLAKRSELVFRLRTAYFDLYKAGRMLELVAAEISLLEGYESVALAGYRAGAVSYGDLVRVQVELATVEERAASLEDGIDTALYRLLEVMGLPSSTELPLPAAMPVLDEPPDWELLKEMALKSNPDLMALGHLVEMGKAGERLADRGYFPDLVLGIDYIETGDAIDPLMEGSGKDPWGVNLSVSIPLWFGRTGAARRSATAEKRMHASKKKAKEDEIVTSTREAYNLWKESRRKVELYSGGIIPRTEQLLETTYSAYRGGKADFLDVIASQRQLLSYRIVLLDADVRSAKMISRLDFLLGDQGTGLDREAGTGEAGNTPGRQEGK